MNCQETLPLLHGYVDGELDLTMTLALEQHLEQCPACTTAQSALQTLRSEIKGGSLYFAPPPGLRGRIQAAVRGTGQAAVRGAGQAARARRSVPWRWLAVAASLAFVALAGWSVSHLVAARSDDLLARELVASHVRAQLLPSHQFDVESSDQHTVKPWYEGKLDFAPPVCDLENQGFNLIGGRLDYLNERPVAALVYQRRKHHISLYIWPSPDPASAPETTTTRKGYHLIHWTQAGLTYWAVSDLNPSELQEFVRLIQERAR